jgi:hypothetical protein
LEDQLGDAKRKRKRTDMEKLVDLAMAERARTGGRIENPDRWDVQIVSLEAATADQSQFDEQVLQTVDSTLILTSKLGLTCAGCSRRFSDFPRLIGLTHVVIASHKAGELMHHQGSPLCSDCAEKPFSEIAEKIRSAMRTGRLDLPLNVGAAGTA